MADPLKIDLYSDPVCPWCLVGLARLDLAIGKLPENIKVDVEHHPFLLDANTPEKGEDVVEMLTRKYGREPYDMWDRIEYEAKISGVDLDMRKQKIRPPSQAAQALISAAREKGTQHALARAIGDACYLEAANIADPDILAKIASSHGFSPREAREIATDDSRKLAVEAAAANASAQGINGVPFFIFANKYALSGGQPEKVFEQALETILAESVA